MAAPSIEDTFVARLFLGFAVMYNRLFEAPESA